MQNIKQESNNNNQDKPVQVIVGPTGSGKTGLAINVAKALGGEVISADSRAIYKAMDIGTAKPSIEEMDGVPHFGIDLVGPGERFTVVDFQAYARQKIDEIRARGHLPIIAGGTGLYVDSLVFNYGFNNDVKITCSDRAKMDDNYFVLGIDWSRPELRKRLLMRANKFFEQDILGETKRVAEMYDADSQAMKSNIYPICLRLMAGEIDQDEAVREIELDDWHLAKRQLTWFKRNKEIHWMELDKAYEYILNKYKN